MPSPRLRAKSLVDEPFSYLEAEFLINDAETAYAYWQKHKAAWIAETRRRQGPDAIPDAFWTFEDVPDDLRESDPAEPIEWRDYADAELLAAIHYGHVSERYAIDEAREVRLEQRRRAWIAANPGILEGLV